MRNVKRNIVLYMSATLITAMAYTAVSGTLMQVFLDSLGFSASQIYFRTTVAQAVQVAVSLTCTGIGNRGNFFLKYALVVAAEGILYGGYVPLCIQMQADWGAYLLLLLIGVLNAVATGLGVIFTYKLPYLIYRTEDYGKVTAITGILSSVLQMGMGVLMAALAARYTYQVIMPWVFPVAGVIIILAGLANLCYRPLVDPKSLTGPKTEDRKDRGMVWQVLRMPIFYQLAIPSLFRGFSSGMVGVLAVVAAADLGYSEQITTTMVSVAAGSQLVGCALFGFLSSKVCPRYTIFLSSMSFVCLPLLLIPDSPILFLCLYAVLMMGFYVELYAVPDLLIRVVPGSIAGTYNAYRMILYQMGTLLATSFASFLPSLVILPMTVVFRAISGICFGFLPVIRKAVPRKRKCLQNGKK